MQTDKTKVVCYCRVSTSSKDQYNSFENQRAYFKRELANHTDYELYKNANNDYEGIYADRGISGTMLFQRPQFNKMLEDAGLEIVPLERTDEETNEKYERIVTIRAGKPKFMYIFTTNTSRFARNVEVVSILNDLYNNGVYVVFLERGLSTEREGDLGRIRDRQNDDEEDSRIKSERVKRGMEESRQRGRLFVNDKIYGYNYDRDTNALKLNPEEAPVVKEMFELYSQGVGTRRIAQRLNDTGKTPKKGGEFGYSTIKCILKNIRYAGFNVYNKYDRSKVFSPKQYSKVRDFKDWIIQESDKIPAIINRELYDRCQAILAGKKSHINNKGRNRGRGKFAGLIYCEKCDKPYNQTGANGRTFFMCSIKKKKGATACKNPNISYKKMEEAITSEQYSEYLRKYRLVYITQLRKLVPLLQSKLKNNNTTEIQRCRKELAEHERNRDMYVELYKQGAYTLDGIKEITEPIAVVMLRLREKLDFYAKSNEAMENDLAEVHKTIAELSNFKIKERYTQEEIIKDIEKITISKSGNIDIMYKARYKMMALNDKHDDLRDVLAEK